MNIRRNVVSSIVMYCAGCCALNAADVTKALPTRLVIIFDKSGSMDRDTQGFDIVDDKKELVQNPSDDPRSRFYQAWQTVESVVQDFSSATETDDFTVDSIVFDSTARQLQKISGKSGALEKIRVLKDSFKPGGQTDIVGALEQAAEIINRIKDEKKNLVILFLTDGEQYPAHKTGKTADKAVDEFVDKVGLAKNNPSVTFLARTWVLPGRPSVIPERVEKLLGGHVANVPTGVPDDVRHPKESKRAAKSLYEFCSLSNLRMTLKQPEFVNGKVKLQGSIELKASRPMLASVAVTVSVESNGKIADQAVILEMKDKTEGAQDFEFPSFVADDIPAAPGSERFARVRAQVKSFVPVDPAALGLILNQTAPVTQTQFVGNSPRVWVDFPTGPFVTSFADISLDAPTREFLTLAWNPEGRTAEISWEPIAADPPLKIALFGPDGKPLPKTFKPGNIFKDGDHGVVGIEVTGRKFLKEAADLVRFKGSSVKAGERDSVSAQIEIHRPMLVLQGYGGNHLLDMDEGEHRVETVQLAVLTPRGEAAGFEVGLKLLKSPAKSTLRVNGMDLEGGVFKFKDSVPAKVEVSVPLEPMKGEYEIELQCFFPNPGDQRLLPKASGDMRKDDYGISKKIVVEQVYPAKIESAYAPHGDSLLPDEEVTVGELSVYLDTKFKLGEREAKILIAAPPYTDAWLEQDGKRVEASGVSNRSSSANHPEQGFPIKISNLKQTWVLKQRTSLAPVGKNGTVPRALVWLEGGTRPESSDLKAEPISYALLWKKSDPPGAIKAITFDPDHRVYTFDCRTSALEDTTPNSGTLSSDERMANTDEYRKRKSEFIAHSAAQSKLKVECETPGFSAVFTSSGSSTTRLDEFLKDCGIRLTCANGASSDNLKLYIVEENNNVAIKVTRAIQLVVDNPSPRWLWPTIFGALLLSGVILFKVFMPSAKPKDSTAWADTPAAEVAATPAPTTPAVSAAPGANAPAAAVTAADDLDDLPPPPSGRK